MSYEIKNPLLPGFYPDPSIVRVDNDFYMVTSSFSYFPGVPVFHSKDLANWEQIGHVLDRPSQLEVNADRISGGIYAPTIRYHEGTFYVITTNTSHGGNFIVTAKKPEGPWSEPHWIEGAPGIDPSLFWDDDGKAYYTGTFSEGDGYHCKIWMSEIDLQNFTLVGEKKNIWAGAMAKAWYPEAPHIYKKDGWYYLMIAEGGTAYYHSVTIARSKDIWGDYIGYDGNPIMTHRHLGMQAEITSTGHADMVELKDGSWYMVMLASRPYGGYHNNMGRETFIAPVIWQNGWPVVCPGTGKLSWSYPAANLAEAPVSEIPEKDDFDGEKLQYQWNFLGTPQEGIVSLSDSLLKIRTVARPMEPAEGMGAVGFVGRRQQHMKFNVQTYMTFSPEENQTAGLILLQNNYHSLRLEMARQNGRRILRVVKGSIVKENEIIFHNMRANEELPYSKEIYGEIEWNEESVILELRVDMQNAMFVVSGKDGREHTLAENVDCSFMGSETAGGFVGAYIGMFASGNGKDDDNYAAFDYFRYSPQ